MSAAPAWEAVILAGGAGRRMGGADKPGLLVGDMTLFDRVVGAVAGARQVIVVGPRRPVPPRPPVRWAREHPPGGGPVAALAAGLPLVTSPLVALLGADLPFLTAAVLGTLLDAAAPSAGGAGRDGALLVDPDGRDQLLAGVWRADALRAALPARPAGVALRTVLTGLPIVRVPADSRTCADCDDPAALARARARAR
jgi:molybdopterin-guanine dinucleotide biosynthesis protein A